MTEQEQRNLENAKLYIELYNNDIDRFVPECYTPDCTVYAMGAGKIEGAADFLAIEKAVLKAAPKRHMSLDHMHVCGDVVTTEVTLLDPDQGDDWSIPFVAVLVMRDGKIMIDRTYADYSTWPGLDGLAAS